MCTVTFIPTTNGVLLSSNRDENPLRPKAFLPMITTTEQGSLIYPADGLASGTWIGVRDSGLITVLLNGSSSPVFHQQTSYSKSRGLIVKELLNSNNIYSDWDLIDLENVAPFTLIIWQEPELMELSWNGKEKGCINKNAGQPHIWSSTTLYDQAAAGKRAKWFANWISKNHAPDSKDLYHMLLSHNEEQDGFVMNRKNLVQTLSISLVEIYFSRINFRYFDLLTSTMALLTLDLKRNHERASLLA